MTALMPDLLSRTPTSSVDAAVASIHSLGFPFESIELVPVGPLESYKGEIVGQVPEANTPLDEVDRVTLYVSRHSISDRLPHDLLEPLPRARSEDEIALEPGQTLDYWDRQTRANDSGRRFLTVVDRALGRIDRDLGRARLDVTSVGQDDGFARRLLDFAGLGELPLSGVEARLMAAVLQRLDQWIGAAGGIETVLTVLLGLSVEIVERPGPEIELPQEEKAALGSPMATLGGGIALGPRFRDARHTLVARLGPVGASTYARLDTDLAWRQRVDALMGFVCPAGQSWSWDLVLELNERRTPLGDPVRSRMGRSSYLGSLEIA